MFNLGCAYRCGKRLCGTHKLKCIIMILFHSDSCQPKLVAILNAILLLLYCLEGGVFFAHLSDKEFHDLIVAIRLIIRFGKNLGCITYDTEV